MSVGTDLQAGFDRILQKASKICRFRYYDQTIGSVWDDDVSLTESVNGDINVYGNGSPATAIGDYNESGTYNGQPVYVNSGTGYWWIMRYMPFVLAGVGGSSYVIAQGPENIIDNPAWVRIPSGTSTQTGVYGVFASGDSSTFSTGSLIAGSGGWVSGIVLPVSQQEGTTDFLLQEQGKVKPSDQKLFVSGGITFAEGATQLKIQLGSPTGEQYYVIPDGVIKHEVENTSIFKKAYIRRLENGSFIGES